MVNLSDLPKVNLSIILAKDKSGKRTRAKRERKFGALSASYEANLVNLSDLAKVLKFEHYPGERSVWEARAKREGQFGCSYVLKPV